MPYGLALEQFNGENSLWSFDVGDISPADGCRGKGSVPWRAGKNDFEPPTPFGRSRREGRKGENARGETFFESREKAAFKKVAVPDGM